MNVDFSKLVDKYAISTFHFWNGVWKIHEVRLETSFQNGIKVLIRGKNTCWFNADNCYISNKNDMDLMLESINHKNLIDSLYFQKIV